METNNPRNSVLKYEEYVSYWHARLNVCTPLRKAKKQDNIQIPTYTFVTTAAFVGNNIELYEQMANISLDRNSICIYHYI